MRERPVLMCASPYHIPDHRWLHTLLDRCTATGASHLYLLPIHGTGGSRSLYSIPSMLELDYRLFPNGVWSEFADFCEDAHSRGIGIIVDLVANHSASDSELIKEHPEWFVWRGGRVVNPGCMDNGYRVTWGDLAQHRFEDEGLQDYLRDVVDFFQFCGVAGFRCDAANQVPAWLWSRLIRESRDRNPDIIWLAETLGCPMEQTISTARAGFDLVTGSHAWWNGHDGWLPDQVRTIRGAGVGVLGFLESHDTERCQLPYREKLDAWDRTLKWSDAAMFVDGFQRGIREKPVVVAPEGWVPADQTYHSADYVGFELELQKRNLAFRRGDKR